MRDAEGTGRSRLRTRLGELSIAIPPLSILLCLRIPAFSEPHWYGDEAGYVSTAQAVLHGVPLYSGIWTNKPPLQIWTIAAVVEVAGTRMWALHLLTLLTAGCAIAGVCWFGSRHLGRGRTLVAACIGAICLGLPVVDAELIVPESLLIAPITWAFVLVIDALVDPTSRHRDRGLVVAGALAAVAIAFQQTALAEAGACLALMLLRSPTRRRDLARFGIPLIALTGTWLGWAVLIAGWSAVSFALGGFWAQYLQGALPQTSGAVLTHATSLALAAGLITVGMWCTRHSRNVGWSLAVWLGAALLVPAAAHHQYPHLLSPAVAPLALTVAALRMPDMLLSAWRGWLRAAPLVIGLAATGVMASYATLDWLPRASSGSTTHTLASYYVGYATAVGRSAAFTEWQDTFDSRVAGDEDVALWLRTNNLAQDPLLVWSSDAWVYALTDARIPLPTAPIYNDEFLVNGDVDILEAVMKDHPAVVVTAEDAVEEFPEIKPLLQHSYRKVHTALPDIIWLRNDVPLPDP